MNESDNLLVIYLDFLLKCLKILKGIFEKNMKEINNIMECGSNQ
jgi:hypothetical protein